MRWTTPDPTPPRPRRTAAGHDARAAGIEQLPWRRLVNPYPAGRDPVRGPRGGDPPGLAPDPRRDRVRGPRRPRARRVRERRGHGGPARARTVRLDPAQTEDARRDRPDASSGSTRATRNGTSSSAAPTSSSARSAVRPSSPTSTAAAGRATSRTSSTTSGSSARSTSSTRRAAGRSSRPTCRSRPATSTCTRRSPRSSTRRGSASASARRRSTTRWRSPRSIRGIDHDALEDEPSCMTSSTRTRRSAWTARWATA